MTEDDDALLTTYEAARFLKLTEGGLQAMRSKNSGPPVVRISKARCRYLKSDLVAWAKSKRENVIPEKSKRERA